MKKAEVNWGIIGCGDVAEVKSGPAFQNIKNSNLIAVMRRSTAKAEDFAKRHGVKFWYSSAEDLIANKAVNAIYVATPPSSHLELSLKVLSKGKDLYLEKPMVLSDKEAEILISAAKKSTSKVSVAHYRRALPAFIKVEELIKEGAIGQVRMAEIKILQPLKSNIIAHTEANWRIIPEESGGGYFFDLAPHQIDLMLKYFGDVKQAYGHASNQSKQYQANDIVTGLLTFESGIHFTGTWAFNINEAQAQDQCKIYGTKGMIEFSFYGDEVHMHRSKKESYHFKNPTNIQEPMIEGVVDYFLENSSHNPCSIKEASKVISIMNIFTSKH